MLTELELLQFITAGKAGAKARRGDAGIGDDCAVLSVGRARVLVTIDAMIEGTHFELRYSPPYFLGRKVVAASLSDIAAMGGVPRAVFVTLGLPKRRRPFFARAVVEGIHEEAQAAGASVLGGDTCASPGPVMLDVAALGEATSAGPILRRGAKRDDGIWVSGTIGGSAFGLTLLQGGFEPWSRTLWTKRLPSSSRQAERSRLDLLAALAHLLPRPRIDLGLALARGRLATAMIDLSDGLSTDLHNLCDASDVGAEIDARRLPLHPALLRAPRRAMTMALSGGEDYELLFTVPRRSEKRLVAAAASVGVPVTRIGRITPRRSGVTVLGQGRRRRSLPRTGYEHFRA